MPKLIGIAPGMERFERACPVLAKHWRAGDIAREEFQIAGGYGSVRGGRYLASPTDAEQTCEAGSAPRRIVPTSARQETILAQVPADEVPDPPGKVPRNGRK